MQFINRDNTLFDILKTNISLISAQIIKLKIYEGDSCVIVDIDFKLLYGDAKLLKLRFDNVREYSFYYNHGYNFYHVESYKLIRAGECFYLSLDPEDDASLTPSDKDQDFILSEHLEGYYL